MRPRALRPITALKLFALALLAAALTACISGFKSNQPVTQLYLLTSEPPRVATPSAAALTLEVLRPVSAPGLNTDSIALLRANDELDYFAASRWAAATPQLLQSLVIDAMRDSGHYRAVESDGTPFVANQLLRVEVRHFEAVYSDDGPPTVHVMLVCVLGDRSGRTLLGTITADSHVKASANRMQAVVGAFQSALNDALTQLATNWPRDIRPQD